MVVFLTWLTILKLIPRWKRRWTPERRVESREDRVARKQVDKERLQSIALIWEPQRSRLDERIYEESLAHILGLHPQVARDRAERLLIDSTRLRRSKGSLHGCPLLTGLATRLQEFFVEHGNLIFDDEPEGGRNHIGLGPSYFECPDDLPGYIIIGGDFNEVQVKTYLVRVGEEPILEYRTGWLPDEKFDGEVDDLCVAAPSIDHLVILLLDDWLGSVELA